MLNTLKAKLLAGLVFTGAAYYIAPPALLAKIGIDKPFAVDDFTVTDLEGKSVSLAECKGRPVMVYIWLSNCPAAFESLPMMESLYQKYKDTQLCFLPVAIDADGTERDAALPKIKGFADQNRIPYPVYNGWGYLPAALYPKNTPYVYLIDRAGVLRKKYVMLLDDRPKLVNDLSAMLDDGSPISKVSMTEPVSPELLAEQEEESGMIATVKYILSQEDYAQLDMMADDLRAGKARFKRGKWKLPVFYKALTDLEKGESWEEKLEVLKKWSAAKPGSVTARAAAGYVLVCAAWAARGSGYSSEVSAENNKLFEERLASARTVLEEAEKLPSACPAVYDFLLKVANGQGWGSNEYENLFKKAVALEPEYPNFYMDKAYHLTPQWYGRPGEWEKFLADSADALKASSGMELYTRVVWDMSDLYGKDLFVKTDVSWPRMRQGYLDIDKKYPGSLILLNSFAWYACAAGDKETAKTVFARIGDRYSPGAWGNPIRYYEKRQWAETKDANILNKFVKVFTK